LKENPEIAFGIENLIREKYNLPLTKAVINEELLKEDVSKERLIK
jgi:hypothetical protein